MKSELDTVVLTVDGTDPDDRVIEDAATVLRRGGLVAVPTETVYGLAADARNEAAVARIFEAKGRPADNPLIVHVADGAGARAVTALWPAAADALAARFWPGPLTLILPRHGSVPPAVSAGLDTVAVRAPAHPVMAALIRAVGPLAAPSANRSMAISPTTAAHVLGGLRGRVDMVLDAGPTEVGIESTVLSLVHEPPRILRPGSVTRQELERVLGPVQVEGEGEGEGGGPGHFGAPSPAGAHLSPGTSPRHYAPRADVVVIARGDAAGLVAALAVTPDAGALLHTLTPPAGAIAEVLPDEPRAYAARLYAALHALDAECSRIVIEAVPQSAPWVAVRDRLRRASA